MQRAIIITACATLIASASGCGDRGASDVRAIHTPLINGFVSGQTSLDVEEALRKLGLEVAVLEKGVAGNERRKSRPSLSVRVLSASGFSFLGVRGDLRLEIVDDELAATWFYPDDADQFDAQMKQHGLAVRPGEVIQLPAATELRTDADFRGRRYWAWEDVNLRRKVDDWIKKYA